MKVAILTMFNGLDSTYSLVNVVSDHLKMMLDNGVEVKMLVSEHCPDSDRKGIFKDKRIEWIKVVNSVEGRQITWYDYSKLDSKIHDTFFEEASLIAKEFEKYLSDVNVCFMHDIHYQGWHLIHNVAIRKAQEKLSNVKFVAFTHSAPNNRPLKVEYPLSCRFEPMPNTTYVYPTNSGLSALAKQYNVPEGKCTAIYNSIDLLNDFSKDVKNVNKHIDLLEPDILIVYPARLTKGKKFEKVSALAGAIKEKCELKVKVIYCDFESMDIDPEVYKNIIKKTGILYGLSEDDVLFTSDIGYKNGFPRSAVLELFTLSNLFICPSYSESFGLTVIEAASRGNFLVLNEAVPALEEVGKKLKAYFMRWDARNFGFDTIEKYKPNEIAYNQENAVNIVNLMREDKVLFAKSYTRQKFSPNWIWYNQIKPLIE